MGLRIVISLLIGVVAAVVLNYLTPTSTSTSTEIPAIYTYECQDKFGAIRKVYVGGRFRKEEVCGNGN